MEIYVVKAGDTLSSIALRYGVPISQVILDNALETPQFLVPGQALVIRFPKVVHTTYPGETLSAIARRYNVTLRQR